MPALTNWCRPSICWWRNSAKMEPNAFYFLSITLCCFFFQSSVVTASNKSPAGLVGKYRPQEYFQGVFFFFPPSPVGLPTDKNCPSESLSELAEKSKAFPLQRLFLWRGEAFLLRLWAPSIVKIIMVWLLFGATLCSSGSLLCLFSLGLLLGQASCCHIYGLGVF